MSHATTNEASCLEAVDWCICTLGAEHDGPHHCECGGEWSRAENGAFIVGRLPGLAGEQYGNDAIGALLGLMGFDDDE